MRSSPRVHFLLYLCCFVFTLLACGILEPCSSSAESSHVIKTDKGEYLKEGWVTPDPTALTFISEKLTDIDRRLSGRTEKMLVKKYKCNDDICAEVINPHGKRYSFVIYHKHGGRTSCVDYDETGLLQYKETFK